MRATRAFEASSVLLPHLGPVADRKPRACVAKASRLSFAMATGMDPDRETDGASGRI
jgi:hypothetical protein